MGEKYDQHDNSNRDKTTLFWELYPKRPRHLATKGAPAENRARPHGLWRVLLVVEYNCLSSCDFDCPGVFTTTVVTLKEGDRKVSAKSHIKATIPVDTGQIRAKITTKLVFCTRKRSLSCFAKANNMPLNNPCMTYVHHRWVWVHQIICYTEPFFPALSSANSQEAVLFRVRHF